MKPNFNLEDLLRKNVHHVPDAYFDKLPNRIMQRVTASPETEAEKNWLPAPLRLALAGSGFAAVFAGIFMLNVSQNEPVSDPLANISRTEIVTYLLASEQIERTDLTLLDATETDMTAEFITIPQIDIQTELETSPLEDHYL